MKVGSKVVYIGGCKNPLMICPETETEVLVISGKAPYLKDHWIIKGYEYASDGWFQSFLSDHLREVDEHTFRNEHTAELAYQATKELIEWNPLEVVPEKRRKIEIE